MSSQPQRQQQQQPTPTAPAVRSGPSAAVIALGNEQLFHLRPVVENFAPVRSAYARDSSGAHLLCLANADDVLFVHRTDAYGPTTAGRRPHTVRTVRWFCDERKRVQDMCFDASGTMLLVLCEY